MRGCVYGVKKMDVVYKALEVDQILENLKSQNFKVFINSYKTIVILVKESEINLVNKKLLMKTHKKLLMMTISINKRICHLIYMIEIEIGQLDLKVNI